MSTEINLLLADKKINEAIQQCETENKMGLGRLLQIIHNKNSYIKVTLVSNWTSSANLCNLWNKMCKGNYTWNNIKIVSTIDSTIDYLVIINSPNIDTSNFPPEKTILFRMEPRMEDNKQCWNEWADPDPERKKFLFSGYHEDSFNNLEWHLSKTYNQLLTETIEKDTNVASILSTVLSSKYSDIGHIKRVDFVKFCEDKGLVVHVYGNGGDKFLWKNDKGVLPSHEKDNALFPYKYTFNAENHYIRGYVTEKLVDGILAECLTFYSGCFNIREIIDEKAYVWLELTDFEKDFETIKTAIEEDWWSQRIDIIRAEKKRILNDLQFFPRIESIINNDIKKMEEV